MDEETVLCSNCQRDIPACNFMMHSIHCSRKISLCPRCNDPVPRTMLKEHEKSEHRSISCKLCGKKMEKWQAVEHRESLCQQRMIGCQFCDLDCSASDLKEHENYCGSRTERCPDCGEYVMLKYQQFHMDNNHNFLKLDDEPDIRPTWQRKPSSNPSKPAAIPAVRTDGVHVEKALSGDTARLASTVNMLSPSKRTNEKPQINSSVSSLDTKSDKDKVSVCDFMSDQEASAELDLLYALQLEQQDQVSQLYAAVESGLLGDSWGFLGEEMRLKSNSRGEVKHPSFSKDEWLPAEDRKNLLSETQTDKLEDQEKNRMKVEVGSQPVLTDKVELPCEFCDIMIPEQLLIEHQFMCRPDLLQGALVGDSGVGEEGTKPLEVEPSSQPALHHQTQSQQLVNDFSKDSSPAVSIEDILTLPCEFCNDLFPGEYLIQHQMVCDLNVNAIPLAMFDDENRPPATQSRKAVAKSPPRQSQHRQPDPFVPSQFLEDSDGENVVTGLAEAGLVNYNVGANNKKVVEKEKLSLMKEKLSPMKENLRTRVKTVLSDDSLPHKDIKNMTHQREKKKSKNSGLQPHERIIHNSLNDMQEAGVNSYLSEVRAALQPTQRTGQQGAQRTSNVAAGARPKGQKQLAEDFLIEGRRVVNHDRKQESRNQHRKFTPDTPVLSPYQLETESSNTVTVRHSLSLYDVASSASARRAGDSSSVSGNGIRDSAAVYGIRGSSTAGAATQNLPSPKKNRAMTRRT